jgi:D-alanyl-D-alanine carboxypeptidase
MSDSSFGNPHGLPHRSNRTTCEDMAKLCSTCLEIPLFRQVVGTKIYKFKAYDPQHRKKVAFHWENTNKLLRRPGFIGIKTGITVTAGPCLASAYEFLGKTYIVIIAKCNKPSRRFK